MRRLNFTGTNNSGEKTTIRGINIDPSGAWVVVLKDAAGNVLWQGRGSTADSRFFGPGLDIEADQVNVTTATGIGLIQILCD